MKHRRTLIAGALLAAAAVALGAYAAHGLQGRLEALGFADELAQRLAWFETATRYLQFHALGLILVAVLATQAPPLPTARSVAIAFLVGVCLFCGSLYGMTFAPAEWRKLGAVVPLGGIAFLVGWIAIAAGAWRTKISPK